MISTINIDNVFCYHYIVKEKIYLFGVNGGKRAADDLKVPFLGQIPIEPEMVTYSDSGKPFIHFKKDKGIINGLTNETDK